MFVNPNSFDSTKEVLRRVGHAASISRYHPDKPNACKWLSVTMDGSPYLVSRTVTPPICVVIVKQRFSKQSKMNIVLMNTGAAGLSSFKSSTGCYCALENCTWKWTWQSHSLAFTGMCSCVIWPKSWGLILKQLRSLSKNALIITKICLFWKWPTLDSGMNFLYLMYVAALHLGHHCQ